jgi:hypothetical protein
MLTLILTAVILTAGFAAVTALTDHEAWMTRLNMERVRSRNLAHDGRKWLTVEELDACEVGTLTAAIDLTARLLLIR